VLNPLQQFLNFITNPAVATILLTLGSIGLIAEIYNPGTFIPGTIGIISLLLGLYALGQLDANFTGIALMILAIILFIAEALTPTFGALAIGGVLAFIFGSVVLFDAPGLSVPWPTIIGLAIGMGLFTVFAGGKALAAQRRQPYTGSEGMIGKTARVRKAFDESGHGTVFFAGEHWKALLKTLNANEPRPVLGDLVEIEAMEGYTLIVRPYK
jgi:membrane-bound serine protease (ClpP class)